MAFGTPVRLKQNATDATGIGSLALGTIITGAAVGDLVVVTIGYGLATSPTISVADNSGGGNTYALAEQQDLTTGANAHCAILYSVLVGALTTSHTITATFSGNVNYPNGLAYKTTPTVGTTVTLDQHSGAKGSSTAAASGSVTTTGTDEILFGGVTISVTGTSLTEGAGWTEVDVYSSTSTKSMGGMYRIEAGTGSFNADATIANSDWAAVIAAFKATAAATGGMVQPNPRRRAHARLLNR